MADLSSIRYRAFLSYSHRDEAWGRWLHRALERTRVSSDLVGRQTSVGVVPPSLRPIFRDREDYSVGASLTKATLEALEASQFLIVLCSPNAVASRYVNEEIRLFKAMGRGNRILSVIIDGEPGDPARECFPHALRHKIGADGALTDTIEEPIAADARENGDGREGARLKLVAGLLGLALDEIVRRAERERRRVLRLWIGGLSAIAVTLAGLGVWAEINRRRAAEERDVALLQQSRHLAAQAAALVEAGDHATAAALVLEALPDARQGSASRPVEPSAQVALMRALAGLREVRTLRIAPGEVTARFSDDDRRIVGTSVAEGRATAVSVWDAETGRPLFSTAGAREVTYHGGRYLFVCNDREATRIDVETGQPAGVLRGEFRTPGASRDGSRAVLVDRAGRVVVWRPEDGSTVRVDMAVEYGDAIALSADGRRIVRLLDVYKSGAERVVEVRNAADGTHRRTLTLPARDRPGIQSVFWGLSDDGGVLIMEGVGDVEFFKLDGEPRHVFQPGRLQGFDGARLLIMQGRDLQMWDLRTFEGVWTWSVDGTVAIRQADFSSDGRNVAALAANGLITVLNASTGKHITSSGSTGVISGIGRRPAGFWLSGETLVAVVDGNESVSTLAFDNDQHRIVGTGGRFARHGRHFLTTTKAGSIILNSVAPRYAQPLRYEAGLWLGTEQPFLRDGRRLLLNHLGGTILIDAHSRQRLRTLGPMKIVKPSPDGRLIVGMSEDGILSTWDAATGRPGGSQITLPDARSIRDVEPSSDMTRLAIARSEWGLAERIEIVEFPSGKVVTTVVATEDKRFDQLRSLPGQRFIARQSTNPEDASLVLWDSRTGAELGRVERISHAGGPGLPSSGSVSPDGSVALVREPDGGLSARPLQSGRPTVRFDSLAIGSPGDPVWTDVAFSGDSRRIVVVTDRTVQAWDVATGKPVLPDALLLPLAGGFTVASTSRDGRRALIQHSQTGWFVADFERRGRLQALERDIVFFHGVGSISPDGERVVLAKGVDGYAAVFDVGTGGTMALLRLDRRLRATEAMFAPDGRSVLLGAGTQGGEPAVVWWDDLSLQQLVEAACAILPRPLTFAERHRFFLEPLPKTPVCGRHPLQ